MNILAINCDTSASLSVFLIFKTAFQIILSGIPIIMVIFSSIDLSKAIIKSEADKDVYKNFIKKIVAFILIFLIMPITNVVLSVIDEENFDKTNCWVMANRQYINRLKEKEQEQRDAEKQLRESQMAEKLLELEKGNQVVIPEGSGSSSIITPGNAYERQQEEIRNSIKQGEFCTGYVNYESTFSDEKANEFITELRAASHGDSVTTLLQTVFGYNNVGDFAKSMANKCVKTTSYEKKGDIYFISALDSNRKCLNNNWNCIIGFYTYIGNNNDLYNKSNKICIIDDVIDIDSTNCAKNLKTISNSYGDKWSAMVVRPYS